MNKADDDDDGVRLELRPMAATSTVLAVPDMSSTTAASQGLTYSNQ